MGISEVKIQCISNDTMGFAVKIEPIAPYSEMMMHDLIGEARNKISEVATEHHVEIQEWLLTDGDSMDPLSLNKILSAKGKVVQDLDAAVPVPRPTPVIPDSEVRKAALVRCIKMGCGKLVTMDLTHEDGDMVQYDGACPRCGSQYHLILDKEEV